jgi:hypothetical protein
VTVHSIKALICLILLPSLNIRKHHRLKCSSSGLATQLAAAITARWQLKQAHFGQNPAANPAGRRSSLAPYSRPGTGFPLAVASLPELAVALAVACFGAM